MQLLRVLLLSHAAGALSCFECRESYDHNGNQIGPYNDEGCYSNSRPTEFLKVCADGVVECETEITAHWRSEGSMEYIFVRQCGEPNVTSNGEFCAKDRNGDDWRKYCKHFCLDNGCNTDNKVENGLGEIDGSGNAKELSCYSCSSTEDETTSGCEGIPDATRKCPAFANSACFAANTTTNISNVQKSFFYKGCSSFGSELVGDLCEKESYGSVGDAVKCRTLCERALCNAQTLENAAQTTMINLCVTLVVTFISTL